MPKGGMRNSKRKTVDSRCALCGMPASDRHHLLNGPRRALAEKYGLWVWLCRPCHMKVHSSRTLMDELRRKAQRKFQREHPQLSFQAIFKVNYLDEVEDDELRGYSIDELSDL